MNQSLSPEWCNDLLLRREFRGFVKFGVYNAASIGREGIVGQCKCGGMKAYSGRLEA